MHRALTATGFFPAWAAAAPAAATGPGVEGLATTLFGLFAVLALIFGAAWLVKRIGYLPAAGKGPVRVLGGASVGTRERVVVVEVEDARLVLGVAPGRVQTLHVLPRASDFQCSLDAQQAPKAAAAE
jgi:flagellar protein FliO/FliZ